MESSRRFELSAPDRAFVVLLAAAVGALLAVGVAAVSAFAARHDLPLPAWLHAVARLDAEWLWWGRPAMGLVLGVVAGLLLIDHSWRVDITSDRIVARRGNDVRRIPAHRVGVVYRTGRRTVVIEGSDGASLFNGTVEGERSALPTAFVELGYPWDDV